MIKIIPLMAALSVSPVAAATMDVWREPVEDNAAAATVQEDPATTRALERHRTDPYFTLDAVAKELRSADGDVPDEVIGHLLWAIRANTGNKVELYYLLRALQAGGRADVADQFLEGLHDSDAKVRSAAENGLSSAPSSRRMRAGLALIDRLRREDTDPGEYHTILGSLEQLASPALKSKSSDLLSEFKSGRAKDVPEGQFAAWKSKTATVLIGVLGPEEALATFRTMMDLDDPLERVATAGAVEALTVYAGENFPEMDPKRRDALRDLLRDYGIDLLAQDDTVEKAKRNTAVREAVAYLFVPVIGIGGRRPTDVTTISAALEAAVRVESPGTRVEEMFSSLQTVLATAPRRNTR